MSYTELIFSNEFIKQKIFTMYNADYISRIKDKNAKFLYMYFIYENHRKIYDEKIPTETKQQIMRDAQKKYQYLIQEIINGVKASVTMHDDDFALNSQIQNYIFSQIGYKINFNVQAQIKKTEKTKQA